MKVGIVGATGLVGQAMSKVLDEKIPDCKKVFFGSSNKKGRKINGIPVLPLQSNNIKDLDYALFAVSNAIAKEWVPQFTSKNIVVIDNSSAFRMKDNVPLIIPEINADNIKKHDKLIANPNCSTIGFVLALSPLLKDFDIQSTHLATYQAVSGAGKAGIAAYNQQKDFASPFDREIMGNLIAFVGEIEENGFCTEELKTIHETHKILNLDFPIYPHVVRVPVENAHCEAITVHLDIDFDLNTIKKLFSETPGLILSEKILSPIDVSGKDDVFVSRLRKHSPKTLQMWVSFDNVRKGAATNTIQILQYMEGRCTQ